jgi:F-type H+-transporting ATPase subunit b
MLIDWFTVSAQLVNFLILVWLLKRFLYKPILAAIDDREKRIAAQLAAAEEEKTEAQKEREAFARKNEEFDRQRADLLEKAQEEAKAEHQRLLDDARRDAEALGAKRREALRKDARNLNQAIRRRTQQEVFAIARKALSDLAAASLEERMADVFIRRLRKMDEPAKGELTEALRTTSDPALVRSAFELPEDQRAAIRETLKETLSADIPVRFETSPKLISGIELIFNGRKSAWSIAEYLGMMEREIGELLQESGKSKSTHKAGPGVREAAPEAGKS